MQDPTSDLTFRPEPSPTPRRDDAAWEAVVREELVKLRRRTPRAARVVPAARRPPRAEPDAAAPPEA
ncbi:MAG TPA: hypothetical protein VHF51_02925 [Solirubrobacteraceae bacterium]|jgi:hypothetical protein|nr:hypothetical protein [Solirubrobacteraceae bacterium]